MIVLSLTGFSVFCEALRPSPAGNSLFIPRLSVAAVKLAWLDKGESGYVTVGHRNFDFSFFFTLFPFRRTKTAGRVDLFEQNRLFSSFGSSRWHAFATTDFFARLFD